MASPYRKRTTDELERIAHARRSTTSLPEILLVADNLRSALNVGSLFRTADALGVKALWLCGISARPPHREILKTALGATDWVPWQYEASVADAATTLALQGYHLVGLEQAEHAVPLQKWVMPDRPVALFVGNEVTGLSEEVLPLLQECIEIPQMGSKHSLNVTVATGMALWAMISRSMSF